MFAYRKKCWLNVFQVRPAFYIRLVYRNTDCLLVVAFVQLRRYQL